ncbi:histidinol phosphate phosphatase [Trinickia terrae]|uniref:Histidinol phosphate phosphatase n=2 Tax=Trinickia terrae TaxID=2571161 RepID=A0A4U1IDU4_9BURK|nr:histidinol phosphate phosphatase [Trinickia terrae]
MADFCQFLELLGYEARSIALTYFRSSLDVITKSDETPVTIADREIEERLRQMIASRFPSHNLVGEEHGGTISSGINWVIDPIDGTKSFICGIPLFGTLVAVLRDRRPILGLIEISALRERWIGHGGYTTFNGEPCSVSQCRRLADARLCATDQRMFSGNRLAAFELLSQVVRITRFGTDSYGYALLASGHVDLVVEADLKFHDVMALTPVIEGAGGVVTTWSGEPITDDFKGDILAASTAELHAEAMQMLTGR